MQRSCITRNLGGIRKALASVESGTAPINSVLARGSWGEASSFAASASVCTDPAF